MSGGDYPVRAETRERVLQAASDLDFHPNRLARALVTAQTLIIGAIVDDISDPSCAEIVRGLEDTIRKQGYLLIVCSSDRIPKREIEYVQALLSCRVDGLILAGAGVVNNEDRSELRKSLDAFRTSGCPVVMLAPNSYKATSILPNDEEGARLITRHLISLGHKSIGFISGPNHLHNSSNRLRGHQIELKKAGIDWQPDLVETGGFTAKGGGKAVAQLIERRSDITAVFAESDLMALGVLKELESRSIRVPEEMSVAGFGDVRSADFACVPLTTIAVPMLALGAAGARMLLDMLAGKRPRSRALPVDLVERQSTSIARRKKMSRSRNQ